jgi:hypothetical protein
MSANAVCDVCTKVEKIETTPLGLAMMPKHWFVTVQQNPSTGELLVTDVCSQTCAEAYDHAAGRNETVIEDLQDGEVVTRTVDHNAGG